MVFGIVIRQASGTPFLTHLWTVGECRWCERKRAVNISIANTHQPFPRFVTSHEISIAHYPSSSKGTTWRTESCHFQDFQWVFVPLTGVHAYASMWRVLFQRLGHLATTLVKAQWHEWLITANYLSLQEGYKLNFLAFKASCH